MRTKSMRLILMRSYVSSDFISYLVHFLNPSLPSPHQKKDPPQKCFLYFGKWNSGLFIPSSKNPPQENFLSFREWKPRKDFLYFLKRKPFLYFGNRKPEKTFYILGNECPEKTSYIQWSNFQRSKNEKLHSDFLYFRKWNF